MKPTVTRAIILRRVSYGEADRILTILTPDYGKRRVIAKGVRRIKSKLAGGIELFSISEVTFIQGRGEIATLISSRLINYYGNIVNSIERVQQAYELIKILNRATEDETEGGYFDLLEQAFIALDDINIDDQLIQLWFFAQLLRLGGHQPNLQTDDMGGKLSAHNKHEFNSEMMAFGQAEEGIYTANHIKFMRLIFSNTRPKAIQSIEGLTGLVLSCRPIVQAMLQTYIRL